MPALFITRWFQRVPKSVVLFATITLASLAGLVALSWQVLSQDRAVNRQHWLERCETAADAATATLSRQLAELRGALADAAAGRPIATPGRRTTRSMPVPRVVRRVTGSHNRLYWLFG